jgi:microcystin-dependent protein
MAFWAWSKTPANNATADATINWQEGQAPSSVNDSSRAMMARLAEFRDDQAGTLTTSGSSTAYTVSTNQVFDSFAHLNGQRITFVVHATCGDSPTLNVDGLGAKPIRTASGVNVTTGAMIALTPYEVTYFSATNEFIIIGTQGFNVVPIGAILPYVGSSAPNSNWVLPFGQAISRTTYSTLFALTSVAFGSGDGSTTFNIPDLRGRAVFGLDNMGGSAANRITNAGSGITGTTLGATGGAENVVIAQANLPNVTLTTNIIDPGHSHTLNVANINGASSTAGPGVNAPLSNPNTNTAFTGITANTLLGGSNIALNKMTPAMVLPIILRVL